MFPYLIKITKISERWEQKQSVVCLVSQCRDVNPCVIQGGCVSALRHTQSLILNKSYVKWWCWVRMSNEILVITKLVRNLLERLGLWWRISLFVNSEPDFWTLFESLCVALLGNKLKSAPYLIITSWKASENWDHCSVLTDIWYLVIWKAIKTRWNIVRCPQIEISWNVLPFFWGDLLTSHALGKNYEMVRRKNIQSHKVLRSLAKPAAWHTMFKCTIDNPDKRFSLPTCWRL